MGHPRTGGGCAVTIGNRSDFYLDGNGFVLEISDGDGGQRLLVRIHGKLIRLLARDAEFARNVFRAQPHVDVRVGIVIDEPGIGRNFVAAHGHHGHGLGAARDDDLGRAAANALGGERDGLQAG